MINWRSAWPFRSIRAYRKGMEIGKKAVLIWGANPWVDKEGYLDIINNHYGAEIREINAIRNERLDLGNHSFCLGPVPYNARSLEIQLVFDVSWHGIYGSFGWDRYNHELRIGFGLFSLRFQWLAPVPAPDGSGMMLPDPQKMARQQADSSGDLTPPGTAVAVDAEFLVPESNLKAQWVYGPGLTALCGKCFRPCEHGGRSPDAAKEAALRMGWVMMPIDSPVCPECAQGGK